MTTTTMTRRTTPGRPALAAWLLVALWTVTGVSAGAATPTNLTCYQCERNALEECGPASLLPCPATKDRCVTHISKDPKNGFVLKRECGLGPCGFDDEMMNRGLGLRCDRSKPEYFCIFCCKESGCNKDAASAIAPPAALIALLAAAVATTGTLA